MIPHALQHGKGGKVIKMIVRVIELGKGPKILIHNACVIQCLTLNYDLDLTLVKHSHCTLSHGTLHLCQVILKCHQNIRVIQRTRNTVI